MSMTSISKRQKDRLTKVDTSKPAQPKKPKSKRRKLYDLHTWVGFHLALIMFVVLFTGTVATVSNEIDWLIQDDMRVSPSEAIVPGETVSWSEMEAAIYDYAPDVTIGSIYKVAGPHFAYRARVKDEFGANMFIHVNQWTGEVTGETHPMTVQRVFRDLHRYLFMPNVIGLPIVTSMAFILAISLYTGLKTSRNWKTLMFRVRTDKGTRIMVGDAHKAAGLWSIWFFVVMIVTGVWYLIEFGVAIGSRLSTDPPPVAATTVAVAEAPPEIKPPTIQFKPMGDLITIAGEAYPALKPATVFMPNSPGGQAGVQGHIGNPLIRVRANNVRIDAETGEVVRVNKSEDMSAYRYINEMADPLHFGFFGGLPTKLIWFVFGVLMTGLSATGVWLTWKRLRTKAPTKAQFATVPVMLLSMFFFLGWYDRQQGPDIPQSERRVANALMQNGVTASLLYSCSNGGVNLRAQLSAMDGFVRSRSVTVDFGTGPEDHRLSHFGRVTSANISLPEAVSPDALTLSIPDTNTQWVWTDFEESDFSCPATSATNA